MRNRVLYSGLVIIAGVAIWWALSHRQREPQRRADKGEPQKSVQEILEERERQASGFLLLPLGKAIQAKNWDEVKRIYKPEAQYVDLAQIIRALYIDGQISNYTGSDLDQLLGLTYRTLDTLPQKLYPHAGLLVTQFYRLPLPTPDSESDRILKSWIQKPGVDSFLAEHAAIKLVTQDFHPPEKAIHRFVEGYQKAQHGFDAAERIRSTDDIRSPEVRAKCYKILAKALPSLEGREKTQALIGLSTNLDPLPTQVLVLVKTYFKSDDLAEFEAGLKAVAQIVKRKAASAELSQLIVKHLTVLPETLKTPYTEQKSKEILSQISAKP